MVDRGGKETDMIQIPEELKESYLVDRLIFFFFTIENEYFCNDDFYILVRWKKNDGDRNRRIFLAY